MKHVLAAVMAVGVWLGATPADAFMLDFDRWYVEARGGIGLPPRPEANVRGAGPFFNGEYKEDNGFAAAAAVGAYFAPNTRAEIEFGWTHGEDGEFKINAGAAPVPHTGDVSVYSGLINVFHEINIPNERWRPFVGIGLGLAVFDFDDLGGAGFQTNDTGITFNGALHVGVDVPINETFIFTTRLTAGVTTAQDFDANVAGVNVQKESQFYGFFSAGIRIVLDGLIP